MYLEGVCKQIKKPIPSDYPRSTNVLSLLNLSNTENLHGTETSSVSSGHVLVESVNGVDAAELTELLVHVVNAGT